MYIPNFRITPYLLSLIDSISSLRAWIENYPAGVARLSALSRDAMARSAHSSTSIEGNPLTLQQVEALERGESLKTGDVYIKEVKNCLKALRHIEKKAKKPIDEKAVLGLHRIIMKDILPEKKIGRYKTRQNHVVDSRGRRVYTPPSPGKTPEQLRQMLKWINSKQAAALHPVAVSAILHHRFVSIHPFSDGNGRVARALSMWILYKRGFDSRHIFSVDDYFASNREMYYKKIQQARELDGDLTYWIEYTASAVETTLKDVKVRLNKLAVPAGTKIELTSRQEELLAVLKSKHRLSISELGSVMRLTRARLNQIIAPLIEKGIVKTAGRSRATRYSL